jgi:hypothetical protein
MHNSHLFTHINVYQFLKPIRNILKLYLNNLDLTKFIHSHSKYLNIVYLKLHKTVAIFALHLQNT